MNRGWFWKSCIWGVATLTVVFVTRDSASQTDTAVADFYRGKTIRFITGYSAGGTFDTITRLIARHAVKYIPGRPDRLVENMTGAGGLIATNYVYKKAARDGTVVLNLDGGLVRYQALGRQGVEFDAKQFNWLPSPAADVSICVVTKESGWTSLAEAIKSSRQLKLGGIAPGTHPSDSARILQTVLGLSVRLVEGYKGVADIKLAAEAGEVDGVCISYEGAKFAYAAQLESGDVRIIAQVSENPWPGLERVPNTLDMAKTERGRWLMRVGIIGPNDVNRLFTLPPGVPLQLVEALRNAFEAIFKDPEFKADIEKSRLVLRPVSVELIEKVVRSWVDMPEKDKNDLKQILNIK